MKMPRSPKKSSKSWLKRLGSDTFTIYGEPSSREFTMASGGGIVQSFDKTRFQSVDVSEIRLAILTSLFCSNGKSRSQKHRLSARPQAPLLPPPNALVNICVPRFT